MGELGEFSFSGKLLNFVIRDGYKLKGLLLATTEGERYIKLSPHLRFAFNLELPLGTWLQVAGTKKYDRKKEQVQLRAEQVMALREEVQETIPAAPGVILICQKSDCQKRGSKLICELLAAELSDRGLTDTVRITNTGCMKKCKAGPNLVMPDKTAYSQVQPPQVPKLIKQHLFRSIKPT
jgi:(2Fe-2S) ferredoxin